MADGVDAEAEGGEAACYLPMTGEQGELPDPRILIQLARSGVDGPSIPVIHGRFLGALLPHPEESVEEYSERLQSAICRTAAWGIILSAGDRPVAIDLGDASHQECYCPVLIAYLRSLIE
jgi:hypothetical protein